MNDSARLIKTTSLRRTSQVIRPNDSKDNEARFPALVAGLLPFVSIFVRRIAFPLLLLGAGLVLVQPCAGQAGTWTITGSLAIGRYDHTATLLPNGKVLVAGGTDDDFALRSAELYDPASGTWTVTGSLAAVRQYHTATLLPNGEVLVVGGFVHDIDFAFASAELYHPASATWTATGSMGTGRSRHTATLLPNGKVLVAGGEDGEYVVMSAEVYDPTSGTWTATGSLTTARFRHTATLLSNGKVLVAGGT